MCCAEVPKTCEVFDLIDVRYGGACEGAATELMVRLIEETFRAVQVIAVWSNIVVATLKEC